MRFQTSRVRKCDVATTQDDSWERLRCKNQTSQFYKRQVNFALLVGAPNLCRLRADIKKMYPDLALMTHIAEIWDSRWLQKFWQNPSEQSEGLRWRGVLLRQGRKVPPRIVIPTTWLKAAAAAAFKINCQRKVVAIHFWTALKCNTFCYWPTILYPPTAQICRSSSGQNIPGTCLSKAMKISSEESQCRS